MVHKMDPAYRCNQCDIFEYVGPCHGSGGMLLDTHHGGPDSIPVYAGFVVDSMTLV
jgi:hypothetical protein